MFSSSSPLIWLHPPGVYVAQGLLANAAFGEEGEMATAGDCTKVLVNRHGHLMLGLPSCLLCRPVGEGQ